VSAPLKPAFSDLVAVMARLRAPGGCPWDREQTHRSLRPYLIEEAYETLDAIERGNAPELCQELGDLLLQVIFHAQIAAEQGAFTIDDVIAGLVEKLIRRHPHVFGDVRVAGSSEVLANWNAIKAEERRAGAGAVAAAEAPETLSDVPGALPSLALAQQLQQRAARAGFAWPDVDATAAKVREELREVEDAARTRTPAETEAEVGDLLFAAAGLPRALGVDGEQALRDAALRFRARFARMEALIRARGRAIEHLTPAERLAMWRAAR
jgi:tetrapyrrole methylase family protein / MazG family protein